MNRYWQDEPHIKLSWRVLNWWHGICNKLRETQRDN